MKGPPLFCCHASLDKAVVVPLVEEIARSGIPVWLDQWALEPGEPWQLPLMRALAQTDRALLFIGASGLGRVQSSEWATLRRDTRAVVVPVFLPGAPWALYDFRSGDPAPLILEHAADSTQLVARASQLWRARSQTL